MDIIQIEKLFTDHFLWVVMYFWKKHNILKIPTLKYKKIAPAIENKQAANFIDIYALHNLFPFSKVTFSNLVLSVHLTVIYCFQNLHILNIQYI